MQSGQKNLNSSAAGPTGVAAMPASMRSPSYACWLCRAAAVGVVTRMPMLLALAAGAPPSVVGEPAELAGALIRDGGRRLPHPLLGGMPSAAGRLSEAPQPILRVQRRNSPLLNKSSPATSHL
eukprot:scaffold12160_cov60-Phaeocystis_antarctica.AAC.12